MLHWHKRRCFALRPKNKICKNRWQDSCLYYYHYRIISKLFPLKSTSARIYFWKSVNFDSNEEKDRKVNQKIYFSSYFWFTSQCLRERDDSRLLNIYFFCKIFVAKSKGEKCRSRERALCSRDRIARIHPLQSAKPVVEINDTFLTRASRI